MEHPRQHLRFPKAAVDTMAKFRQVTGQVFGTDARLDAPDIAFHVGDQSMDPGQDLRLLAADLGQQAQAAHLSLSVGVSTVSE